MDMVKSFDDDEESINLTGENQEILKLALNDYINERLNVVS